MSTTMEELFGEEGSSSHVERYSSFVGCDNNESDQEPDVSSERMSEMDCSAHKMAVVEEEENHEEHVHTPHSAPAYGDLGHSEDQVQAILDMVTDPFFCAADNESQATHVQALADLNNYITHLVASILSRFDQWINRYYKPLLEDLKNSQSKPNNASPLLRAFFKMRKERRLLETRRMVLEVHMIERILSTIHGTFFSGDVFFGVMDATQIKILDQMYYMMLKDEPWTVVQRWRSFSSSASILPLDEAGIHNIVEDVILEITESITILYPTSNENFHRKLPEVIREANGSQQTVLKAVKLAHKLSRDLQRQYVSARMKVTMAPINESQRQGKETFLEFSSERVLSYVAGRKEGQPGEAVLGTTAFGLECFEGASNKHCAAEAYSGHRCNFQIDHSPQPDTRTGGVTMGT